MIPYSIRCLRLIIDEKESQIDVLHQQINTISHRLAEEVWSLIVQSNPHLTNEMEFSVDYTSKCSHKLNPIGYCVDDTITRHCMFCYVADAETTPLEPSETYA